MPLSYAGVPLVAITPELRDYATQALNLADFHPFQARRGKSQGINRLSVPQDDESWKQPDLGVLRWPSGASRWSIGAFLATGTQLTAIRNLVFTGSSYVAQNLVLDDGVHTPVTASMRLLPNYPVFKVPNSEPLYLLLLVDERYRWWDVAITSSFTTGVTTWANLYSTLNSAVGVSSDTINVNYLKPGLAWSTFTQVSAPQVLDALAFNVGQRIIRKWSDGTTKGISPGSSTTTTASNLALSNPLVLGGSLDLTSSADLSSLLPLQVQVVFPNLDTNGVALVTSNHTVFASGDPSTTNGKTKNFQATGQSSLDAVWFPGMSSTDRSNYVKQFATDWWSWQKNSSNYVFSGIMAWVPDGASDIEWTYWADRIDTRIYRSPLNDLTEDLLISQVPSTLSLFDTHGNSDVNSHSITFTGSGTTTVTLTPGTGGNDTVNINTTGGGGGSSLVVTGGASGTDTPTSLYFPGGILTGSGNDTLTTPLYLIGEPGDTPSITLTGSASIQVGTNLTLTQGAITALTVTCNDTFGGTVGTNLISHTPAPINTTSSSWVAVTGGANGFTDSFKLSGSGSASQTLGSPLITGAIYLNNLGAADGQASVTVNMASHTNGVAGILFRLTDADNLYFADLDPTNSHLRIAKIEAGAVTVPAQVSWSGSYGVDYPLNLSLSGSNITAWQGSSTVTLTDSFNSSATKHGLWTNENGAVYKGFSFSALTTTPISNLARIDSSSSPNLSGIIATIDDSTSYTLGIGLGTLVLHTPTVTFQGNPTVTGNFDYSGDMEMNCGSKLRFPVGTYEDDSGHLTSSTDDECAPLPTVEAIDGSVFSVDINGTDRTGVLSVVANSGGFSTQIDMLAVTFGTVYTDPPVVMLQMADFVGGEVPYFVCPMSISGGGFDVYFCTNGGPELDSVQINYLICGNRN